MVRATYKMLFGHALGHQASLRFKSYIVYGALILSTAAVTVFVLYQKAFLLGQFDAVQAAYETETRLREVDLTILHTIQAQVVSIESIGIEQDVAHARDHVKLLLEFFNDVADRHIRDWPETAALQAALRLAYENTTRDTMAALGQNLTDVRRKLESRLATSRAYRKMMTDDFRARSDSVAVVALTLMLLVFTMLGVINALFFTRLTQDVRTLKKRAQEIVNGQRGDRITVSRGDEVGELIEAINQMADELEEHDRALEIERRKSFHREKMAAIGVLAAGIAHEIGNPIAAISGLMEELKQACTGDASQKEKIRKLDMVLQQTNRLKAITREVSAFARPQLDERELLDLNALIRSACSLMRYDRRWKGIDVKLDLDAGLPAVQGVPDQLMQVVMNLLVNAADALQGVDGRTPFIRLSTGMKQEGDGVYLLIEDNGHGMDKETLQHALEAFYTTKAVGKGTGLGLSLCHSIIVGHGGDLCLESTPGEGTIVRIYVPHGNGGEHQGSTQKHNTRESSGRLYNKVICEGGGISL